MEPTAGHVAAKLSSNPTGWNPREKEGAYGPATALSDHSSLAHDFAVDGAKALPVAGYGATVLSGIDWPMWAALLACVYTALLISEKLWKAWKAWRAGRATHV
jgi:hypothetical protein